MHNLAWEIVCANSLEPHPKGMSKMTGLTKCILKAGVSPTLPSSNDHSNSMFELINLELQEYF